MEETLVERMRHAATHCETQYDAEWEAKQLRDGAAEIESLTLARDLAVQVYVAQQVASERERCEKAFRSVRIWAERHRSRGDDCGYLARMLLAALNVFKA